MRRSSQINQANLFAILMGEKRRKPLVRRALVSQLYPVFFDDKFIANQPAVVTYEEPFQPYDSMGVALPAPLSCIIDDYDPFKYYTDSDLFEAVLPAPVSCVIDDYDPFVNESFGPDIFSPTLPAPIGGVIKDVAFFLDAPKDNAFEPTLPTPISCVINNV